MERKPAGIYVHIPFCIKKCNYCDFLSAPGDKRCVREYVNMLEKGIRSYKQIAEEYSIYTIYIGGGTPSVLETDEIEMIMVALRDTFTLQDNPEEPLEITIEVNPGTVTYEKLCKYRELGINRISMGIQSTDDRELKLLGRIHDFQTAKECFEMARKAGFDNISADIISALPGQTVEQYKTNLETIIKLNPEHISAYSLIIEEGTPFYEKYGENGTEREKLPSEETDREMYALTNKLLEEAGYHRYEISNYSKPGRESRHNSAYWTGRDYFGLGLGASSLLMGERRVNTSDLAEYLKEPERYTVEEVLTEESRMCEFMILGLRMTEGISASDFKKRFGKELETVFGEKIEKLVRLNVLKKEKDRFLLTEYGLDVSNAVFEEFI